MSKWPWMMFRTYSLDPLTFQVLNLISCSFKYLTQPLNQPPQRTRSLKVFPERIGLHFPLHDLAEKKKQKTDMFGEGGWKPGLEMASCPTALVGCFVWFAGRGIWGESIHFWHPVFAEMARTHQIAMCLFICRILPELILYRSHVLPVDPLNGQHPAPD